MTNMDDLTALDATALSRLVADKKVSCVDIMTAFLSRIHAFNPALNAIVALRPDDELMAEARAADEKPAQAWLHGLPIAIKDLAETAGIATTWGSPTYANHIPATDCDMVSRIKAAGAIVIGKTNTPEFGLGSHTYNPVYGTTVNPYDHRLSAGGSSGGAAAALSARLLPIADGSDMMGSLRNPAGFCNVYGFRPTAGLLPVETLPDTWEPFPLATHGPMGKSVQDIAALLDTMATPADQSKSFNLENGRFFQAVTQTSSKSVQGLRIGWLGDMDGQLPMEAGMIDLCQKALEDLTSLGFDVQALSLNTGSSAKEEPLTVNDLFDCWTALRNRRIGYAFQQSFNNPAIRQQMKPELRWEIERGLAMSDDDMNKAININHRWNIRLNTLFSKVELLCLPSAALFPFDARLMWPKQIADATMKTYHEWMSVVIPVSLQGLPALAVPAGFNSNDLPAGIQLIGNKGDDTRVLQAGQLYHQATMWPQRRAP